MNMLGRNSSIVEDDREENANIIQPETNKPADVLKKLSNVEHYSLNNVSKQNIDNFGKGALEDITLKRELREQLYRKEKQQIYEAIEMANRKSHRMKRSRERMLTANVLNMHWEDRLRSVNNDPRLAKKFIDSY